MFIKSLHLNNIGPFKDEHIEFAYPNNEEGLQPVTIITGVNGAGKSIVVDALRAAISGEVLERDIVSVGEDEYKIEVTADIGKGFRPFSTSSRNSINNGIKAALSYSPIVNPFIVPYKNSEKPFRWIVDYWSSKLPADSFAIKSISEINHSAMLNNTMSGVKSNLNLINFICNIDYLRNSEVESERELGDVIYNMIVEVINSCLDNGWFAHIKRTKMMPVVNQNGYELSFDKLSSGNIFMIEHLVLFICKLYSLAVLLDLKPEEIKNIPGLLLIDEIENHLHPKWQKKILPIIRSLFPNLQIILTTHSPFILSALPDVKIYTCTPDVKKGGSHIVDTTEEYSGLPVDEILLSDAFNVTQPFSVTISEIMARRKEAIRNNDYGEAKKLAQKLYELNPDFFRFMVLDPDFKKEKK